MLSEEKFHDIRFVSPVRVSRVD